MPDPNAQAIYNELNKRGVFHQDAQAQAIGHELRARKVVSDPTQGGLAAPAPKAAAPAAPAKSAPSFHARPGQMTMGPVRHHTGLLGLRDAAESAFGKLYGEISGNTPNDGAGPNGNNDIESAAKGLIQGPLDLATDAITANPIRHPITAAKTLFRDVLSPYRPLVGADAAPGHKLHSIKEYVQHHPIETGMALAPFAGLAHGFHAGGDLAPSIADTLREKSGALRTMSESLGRKSKIGKQMAAHAQAALDMSRGAKAGTLKTLAESVGKETRVGKNLVSKAKAAEVFAKSPPVMATEAPVASPEIAPPPAPAAASPQVIETPTAAPTANLVSNYPLADLHLDPARFQYKIVHGKGGVTGSISDAPAWNPDLAGVIHAWRDPADGKSYAVNGHNRVGLANKHGVAGADVKFLDAPDATAARTKGALINIAEGQGTPMDAAKLFRDSGMTPDELAGQGVSLKGNIARTGMALSNLTDPIFNRVVQGDIPVERGAIIGSKLPNPEDQHALVKELDADAKAGKARANGYVAERADRMAASKTQAGPAQSTLFGDMAQTTNLEQPRADVAQYVRSQLGKDASALGGAARNAGRLTKGNNVTDAAKSAEIALQNRQAGEVFDATKNAAGSPTSDILDKAAIRIAKGENADAVKSDTLTQYQRAYPTILKQPRSASAPPDGLGEAGDAAAGPGNPQEVPRGGDSAGSDGGSDSGQPSGVSGQPPEEIAGAAEHQSLNSSSPTIQPGDAVAYQADDGRLHSGTIKIVTGNRAVVTVTSSDKPRGFKPGDYSVPVSDLQPQASEAAPAANMFADEPNDLQMRMAPDQAPKARVAARLPATESMRFDDNAQRPFESDMRLPPTVRDALHNAAEGDGGIVEHYDDLPPAKLNALQREMESLAAQGHGGIFRKSDAQGDAATYSLHDGNHTLSVSMNSDGAVATRILPDAPVEGGMFDDAPAAKTPAVDDNVGLPQFKGRSAKPISQLNASIIPGADEFINQDVAPSIKAAAKGFADISHDLQRLLNPAGVKTRVEVSPGKFESRDYAAQTQRSLRASLAVKERSTQQVVHAMAKTRFAFEKASDAERLDYIDDVETGRTHGDPALAKAAHGMRVILDDDWGQAAALGADAMAAYRRDYFPHIWEDGPDTQKILDDYFKGKSLEGGKAFLKQRVFPTTKEGMALGLKPISTNPIDLLMAKHEEIQKFIMGRKVAAEMKASGIFQFVKLGDRPPDGLAPINDKIAAVYRPPGPGEDGPQLTGHYYAPAEAAAVINNHLGPSLNQFSWYRGLRLGKNVLNQAQLGLSAFHLGFVSIDSAVSGVALGAREVSMGNFGKGLPRIFKSTIPGYAPIERFVEGDKVLKEYYSPGSQPHQIAQIVDMLQAAGGVARMDKAYSTGAWESMLKAARKGNYPGAVLRAPFAIVEKLAQPLMEEIVPRLKLGVFADMARHEMERLPADAADDDVRKAIAEPYDSVDNRMGELRYDNLAWHKYLKDTAMITERSLGWVLGSVREMGGAALDTAAILQRLKAGDPVMTHRMSYAVALPMMAALYGGIYQYLATGQWPQDLKSYYYPKTGYKDESGEPGRVFLPTYMKDIIPDYVAGQNSGMTGLAARLGREASNKSNPMFSAVSDMLQNQDYYGTEIRNPDDPLVKQAAQEAQYVATQFTPFSVEGASQQRKGSAPLGLQAQSFFGINPAPASVNRDRAQQMMLDDIVKSLPQGARTNEQYLLSQTEKHLRSSERQGKDIIPTLTQAVQAGTLTRRQAMGVAKEGRLTPDQALFKRLKLSDALKVYAAGTAKEQASWQPYGLLKLRDAARGHSLTPAQIDEARQVRLLPAKR